MPKPINESVTLLTQESGSALDNDGLLPIEFITPGWGSSGYYSHEVVEAAAPLFAVGTHMYFDHPTAVEDADRPERSVRDLAAIVVEAGAVHEGTGGIRGRAKPIATYEALLSDKTFAANVGVSIRGSATDVTMGEAEGRRGRIIEGLADIQSADFVTHAGRGGRVLELLESARPEVSARAVDAGVAEATVDERREQLSDAIRATYGGTDHYAWVQDFDEATVWFRVTAEDDVSHTWQQTYTVADDDLSVSLTGARTEVRAVTKYVPVTRPGSNPAAPSTTTESREDTMPHIQIEEAEHARLVDAAGRVETLTQERDTAVQRADTAEARLTEHDRAEAANRVLAGRASEAGVQFTALESRGLLADLPVADDGAFDEAAFATRVDEAAAEKKKAAGHGTVRGFGAPVGESTDKVTESAPNPWGRTEQKGA